ncbi:MAG: hypothetical protein L6V93_01575 [Clostridiales bacterium]|nr:MAG: hypothetical protein L6V93_01575 [Clostridiales bacterium]
MRQTARTKTMVLPVLGVMSKNALENSDNSLSEKSARRKTILMSTKFRLRRKNKAMISGIAYFSGDKMIDEGSLHENIYHLLMTKSAKKNRIFNNDRRRGACGVAVRIPKARNKR